MKMRRFATACALQGGPNGAGDPSGCARRRPQLRLIRVLACAGLVLGMQGAALGAGPAAPLDGPRAPAHAIAPSELLQALPAQLDGRPRGELQLRNHTAQGRATSQVTAHYGSGAEAVQVRIVDAGGSAQRLRGRAPGGDDGKRGPWQDGARLSASPSRLQVVLDNGVVVTLQSAHAGTAQLRGWLEQLDLAALRSLRPPAGAH